MITEPIFELPKSILKAMSILEPCHEVFVVGGCVRDYLLNQKPKDFDLTTSATPQQVIALFKDYPVIDTSMRFGTVIVVIDHTQIEITTYRFDSHYEDHRRPSTVRFTNHIEEDLARRDFTINAIAYHPRIGFVDPFDGITAIKQKKIQAVGDPYIRFKEDPLRILRGIRFAAVLGFEVETQTRKALIDTASDLNLIAVERIYIEFSKMLLGDAIESTMLNFHEIFSAFIPEITPMVGFEQCNPNHCFDVYTHTASVVANCPKMLAIRLAAFFHDIGKPHSFTLDEQGIGHFYGHPTISEEIAHEVLNRLKVDNDTKKHALMLIKYHDVQIEPTKKAVRRILNKMSLERFHELLDLKRADCISQHPQVRYRLNQIQQISDIAKIIEAENDCFSLKQLAITGHDLVKLGYKGNLIGKILNMVLEQVLDEQLVNEKEVILNWVQQQNDID